MIPAIRKDPSLIITAESRLATSGRGQTEPTTRRYARLAVVSAIVALTLSIAIHPATGQSFTRRTVDVGLESARATNGVAVADYDRDGDLDVYFVAQGAYASGDSETWNKLFRRQNDGTYAVAPGSTNLRGRGTNTTLSPMGHKMGASWGDYDNDGWPDLFLTQFGPNQLFHNNGNGTFTDVTDIAKVSGGTQLSSSALWVDYDHDGDLDLYVSNYQDFASATPDRRNWLYENLGDGEFEEVAESAGLADDGLTWTTVALDVNNDGLLDFYLANDFGRNKLYVNNGDKTFSEETSAFGVEDLHHGMGIAISDSDANGFFDIYLTNISETASGNETNPLFMNSGNDSFANHAEDLGISRPGWGWGTEFFDIENDGDEDLFVVTGLFQPDYINVLYKNTSESGSLDFENITESAGLADSTAARGLAIYDFDDDGDHDLLVSNFLAAPALYENSTTGGNWIKIKLEGTLSNRDAFGSVVELSAGGTLYRRYHHGAQFLGQNILPVHFGLGTHNRIDKITVKWTNGHVDEIYDVDVNQTIEVRETLGLVQTNITAETPLFNSELRLLGNYPNPVTGSTNIRFEIGSPGGVELQVVDLLGRTIHKSTYSFASIGTKTIQWDRSAGTGAPVSAGVYAYQLRFVYRSTIETHTQTLVVRD